MSSFILVVAFTVLMLLAIPVGHALIIAAGLTLAWQAELPLMIVAQQMYQQTQSFPMLALPFFMMAGSLMRVASSGRNSWASPPRRCSARRRPCRPPSWRRSSSWWRSPAGAAATSAMGSGLIVAEEGDPAGLRAANNATSAIIDIMIPPSIPLILYSLVSGVSIADLFTAGNSAWKSCWRVGSILELAA